MTRSGRSTSNYVTLTGRADLRREVFKEETTEKGRTRDAKLLDMKLVSNLLERMSRRYGHLRCNELEGDALTEFTSLNDMIDLSKGTQVYSAIIGLVKEHFKEWRSVEPGTVASHYFGCLLALKEGMDSPECLPICSESLKPPMYNAVCKKTVATYSRDRGISMYSVSGDSAVVHVVDDDFSGFDSESISKLKKNGVARVTVTITGSDSSATRTVYSETSVEDLSCGDEKTATRRKHRIHPEKSVKCEEYERDYSWVIILVIAIVVILFLVATAIICYNRKEEMMGFGGKRPITVTHSVVTTLDPSFFHTGLTEC